MRVGAKAPDPGGERRKKNKIQPKYCLLKQNEKNIYQK